MVTEAGLAVVCWDLLAGLHTGVGVSQLGVDAGVLIAVLTLLTDPGGPGLWDGQVVATTDTALRSYLGHVCLVTLQS